jgi:hypothetical protein
MKAQSIRMPLAVALFWAQLPATAIAGDCLPRPEPLQLRSDSAQWSMVIARGSECIQGLRGKSMIFESVSVLEPPKTGLVVLQGPSFRYSAGPDAGSDSFKLMIVGSSMRMHGTSTVTVEVQVR